MTTYTVFEDGYEENAVRAGLTLQQAFHCILEACGYDHRFEERGGVHVLVVSNRRNPEFEPTELTSLFTHEIDAKRDLILRAMNGRLKSHMALPDDKFRERLRFVLAIEAREREAVRAP